MFGDVHNLVARMRDVRLPEITAVDDEPQFPAALVRPEFAHSLSMVAAAGLVQPPSFAGRVPDCAPSRALLRSVASCHFDFA